MIFCWAVLRGVADRDSSCTTSFSTCLEIQKKAKNKSREEQAKLGDWHVPAHGRQLTDLCFQDLGDPGCPRRPAAWPLIVYSLHETPASWLFCEKCQVTAIESRSRYFRPSEIRRLKIDSKLISECQILTEYCGYHGSPVRGGGRCWVSFHAEEVQAASAGQFLEFSFLIFPSHHNKSRTKVTCGECHFIHHDNTVNIKVLTHSCSLHSHRKILMVGGDSVMVWIVDVFALSCWGNHIFWSECDNLWALSFLPTQLGTLTH